MLKNSTNERITNSVFSLELPAAIDSYQIIGLDHEDKNNLNGNHVKFTLDKINPYSAKHLNFIVNVDKSSDPLKSFDKKINYLADDKYLEITHPTIMNLAAQLKADTPLKTSQQIYNWLISNIHSTNYVAGINGALHTLQNTSGDCTEFSYLFVSLARANKIPARVVKGLYIPQASTVIDPMDYHDWAEFYDGDKWVIVDAQKQHFDSDYSNYLMIAELTDSNASQSRFSISDQRINVSFE